VLIANAAFDRILNIVATRTHTDVTDVRFLMPQELEYYVAEPQEYRDRLDSRKKSFLVYQGEFPLIEPLVADVVARTGYTELKYNILEMSDPFIAEGTGAYDALDYLDRQLNLFSGPSPSRSGILQGVATYFEESEAVIVGSVAIIRDPKTERLRSGDILVASSTTPDFMDAIRRCRAMVVDYGGLASHAAIASRELRKPCIVGTRHASHVLRDGDKVRLNLHQGTVEIVEETQIRDANQSRT